MLGSSLWCLATCLVTIYENGLILVLRYRPITT